MLKRFVSSKLATVDCTENVKAYNIMFIEVYIHTYDTNHYTLISCSVHLYAHNHKLYYHDIYLRDKVINIIQAPHFFFKNFANVFFLSVVSLITSVLGLILPIIIP